MRHARKTHQGVSRTTKGLQVSKAPGPDLQVMIGPTAPSNRESQMIRESGMLISRDRSELAIPAKMQPPPPFMHLEGYFDARQ